MCAAPCRLTHNRAGPDDEALRPLGLSRQEVQQRKGPHGQISAWIGVKSTYRVVMARAMSGAPASARADAVINGVPVSRQVSDRVRLSMAGGVAAEKRSIGAESTSSARAVAMAIVAGWGGELVVNARSGRAAVKVRARSKLTIN